MTNANLSTIVDTLDPGDVLDTIEAARALLLRIETITTEQFALGGEKAERDRLRRVLTRIGAVEADGN